ncbi:hypothetical protein DS831_05375 [Bombilactobacillus bombi]|uniref:Uncharacterized protein n=1 Tax=Bombilactobacillus bombi TaxID=1303590 RepID=A0A3R6UXA5_9LACO|nr:hypothetical protein DS831_05375 [Bombilactobacillus bombi]
MLMCIFTISSGGQKQSLQPAQQMTKQKHFYKGELIKAGGQLEFVDYPDNFADLVKKEKVPRNLKEIKKCWHIRLR